jgi:RHS repeat-associated protein
VAVTDANRNIVERREYEPYGYQLTSTLQNGPGYTGHVQDASTGLTYMQQRYYDPLLGRFLSVDPVTMHDTGDARHFNRYGYANNNPYAYVDPDGRLPFLAVPIIVGITLFSTSEVANAPAPGEQTESLTTVDRLEAAAGALPPVRAAQGARIILAASSGSRSDSSGEGKRGTCPSCGGRTSSSEAGIARDQGMSRGDVKDSIHQAKNNGPESGDLGRKNGDVEVCRDCGEIFPQTPRNGLGDSIGNISDPIERKK